MKTLAAAAALGTLLLTGSTLVAPPAQAVETCRGLAATIVDTGAPGVLVGTPGDDVIVSHGSFVQALGGNDVICSDADGASAQAGPGDDVVDTTAVSTFTSITLGTGSDTFYGGPGDDQVWGAEVPGLTNGDVNPVDTEPDTFSTGAGRDFVFSGTPGTANLDRVVAGLGDDRVELQGFDTGGSLDVGPGTNDVDFGLRTSGSAGWTVDSQRRTISGEGSTLTWHGDIATYVFALDVYSEPTSLTFLGSKADDSVSLAYPSAMVAATIRLRGGDDSLRIEDKTAPGSIYSMGPGRDSLEVNPFDSFGDGPINHQVRVDLDAHRLDYGTAATASVVNGVERLDASGIMVRARGDEKANEIRVAGCDVRASGRAGNDIVKRLNEGLSFCHGELGRLAGGPGNDHLVGTRRTDDVLVGGRGYDVANGGGGDDTCVAEVTSGCERSSR